ncbi:uncharacterized protein LOC101898989 [Musca domestica]|uniref:Uncharacterized protein LOC101898989 n=1 Tax=Musca domestica TaxID=7370 RepID=A0A1I8MB03_MUSDO|nr:uncharacterized protein LOC101898989 [Musca domestica]
MKIHINKIAVVLLLCCVLLMMTITCSAGVYFGPTLNDVPVHTVKVIHQHPSSFGPTIKTLRIFKLSNDNIRVDYGQSRGPHHSTSNTVTDTYRVIHQQQQQPQSPFNQFEVLQQQQQLEESQPPATINVIREHRSERIKTQQTIRVGAGVTDGGYPSFGDAFETFKSLKAYGAFDGPYSALDSYGKPIAKSWQEC